MKNFQEQVFCITGVVPMYSRTDLFDHISARDGEYVDRMTKRVTILVLGEGGVGTTKYDKAVKYGTEIMGYEDFIRWLYATPLVDSSAHLRPLEKGSARKYLCGAHVTKPVSAGANESQEYQPEPDILPIGDTPTQKGFDWTKLLKAIAAIIIVIFKGALVVCGMSICVVLWLCGIPVGK